MKQFIILGVSMLMCITAFARENSSSRGSWGDLPMQREKTGIQLKINPERLSLGSTMRADRLKGNVAAPWQFKTNQGSADRKSRPAMLPVVTDKLLADQNYPTPGLVVPKLDGTVEQKTEEWDGLYSTFGVADGKLYGFKWDVSGTTVWEARYNVVDLQTYQTEQSIDLINGDASLTFSDDFIIAGAFVPEEMCFYGVTNSEHWVRFDVQSQTTTVLNYYYSLDEHELWSMMCYNPVKKQLISYDCSTGKLYAVNPADGQEQLVATLPFNTTYNGGIAFDVSTNNYIYQYIDGFDSTLQSIDADTYEVTPLCTFERMSQFNSMVCYEQNALNPASPETPEIQGVDFPNGSLVGTFNFKMPGKLAGGDPVDGDLTYVIEINDEQYSTGTAAGGTEVKAPISYGAIPEPGTVKFAVYCMNGELKGNVKQIWEYIGDDTPKAPADVTFTETTVSWQPVTEGVHDGYIDPDAVTYNVSINGRTVATQIHDTSCPSNLPEGEPLEVFRAEVTAVFHGRESAPGVSGAIPYGGALDLPLDLLPTSDESLLFGAPVDANNDGKTWRYDDWSAVHSWAYFYHEENSGDDWLFLPAFNVPKAHDIIRFSMDAWVEYTDYTERFEVKVGKARTPEAMTTTIIAPTSVNSKYDDRGNFSGSFTADEAGVYYIGVHAISDAYQFLLHANNFKVENTNESAIGPKPVTDVSTEAAAQGELKAMVTFTLPTQTRTGSPLEGNLVAKVTSKVEEKEVTGAPGETVTATVATVQGDNRLQIKAFYNDSPGEMVIAEVYTGVDRPCAVRNFNVTVDKEDRNLTFTWDTPDTGVNGGYVRPTGLNYYLYSPVQYGYETVWVKGDLIGTDINEFHSQLPENTAQMAYYAVIAAENEAGDGALNGITIAAGTPHETPMLENWQNGFGQNVLNYAPMVYDFDDRANAGSFSGIARTSLCDGLENAPYPYVYHGWCTKNNVGHLSLPKFSTMNQSNVAFTTNMFVGGVTVPYVTFSIKSYDIPEEEIYVIDASQVTDPGYRDIVIPLPAQFQNKEWVQITVHPHFDNDHVQFVMGSYEIRNMVANDMTVSVQAPGTVYMGHEASLVATVRNIGTETTQYKGGRFILTDGNGMVLQTKACESVLPLDKDAAVTEQLDFTPQVENLGDLNLKFQLNGADDCMYNNAAEASMNVSAGKEVAIDDLVARENNDGIQLTWSVPEVYDGFESFELCPAFQRSGSKIADFTNVASGKECYFFNVSYYPDVIYLPNVNDYIYKSGFNVYNGSQLGKALHMADAWNAPDGDNLLIAFCPSWQPDETLPAANEWLISPAVQPGSEFSFQVRPVNNDFGKESVRICYSTVDTDDPAQFLTLQDLQVGTDDTSAPVVWETVSVQVPENARRMAIQYISRDVFGIAVDNVRYVPEAGLKEVSGYTVHKATGNDPFQALGETGETAFTDVSVEGNSMNSYYVVPNLSDGTSGLRSNIAVVQFSQVTEMGEGKFIGSIHGAIVLVGFNGERFTINSVDGRTVAVGTASENSEVPLPAGVYVVKAGKDVAKVIVR